MQPDKRLFPDANFTLRVTYGKVEGFKPQDGKTYRHFTTLEGIMEKENPDIYDYVVEPRLKELYHKKDYGRSSTPGVIYSVGLNCGNSTFAFSLALAVNVTWAC